MKNQNTFTKLAAPFNPSDLEWRAGATNEGKTQALALAYITSRAVMDRLDEVVSPENWRDEYQPGPDGGLICGLSLRVNEEWITKWDGAENTQFEEVKGGLSGSFKRAAVKWGIGRYLYKLPKVWVACEQRGKTVVLKTTPDLPEWALPSGDTSILDPVPEDREKQILKELGYEDSPKPANNGNRAKAWNAGVVKAIIAAGLVEDAAKAVKLLNQSDLPTDTTSEDAVVWAKENHKA